MVPIELRIYIINFIVHYALKHKASTSNSCIQLFLRKFIAEISFQKMLEFCSTALYPNLSRRQLLVLLLLISSLQLCFSRSASRPNGGSDGGDGSSSTTMIIVWIVVAIVALVALVACISGLVWWRIKRRNFILQRQLLVSQNRVQPMASKFIQSVPCAT